MDYSSDDSESEELFVKPVPPNSKDAKYGIERPLTGVGLTFKPEHPLSSDYMRAYTLWQGFNLPAALSRYDDLFILFDTFYTTGKDKHLEWLKGTFTTPCIRKRQQSVFKAVLELCGLDDPDCLKEYNRRLSNIYYFNAPAWIQDNLWRFRVQRSKSATGRKRNDGDLDLIQKMALDPDLKMAGPEWQSSLAQAFRKVTSLVATEAEIATRVAFFKDVALLRKRAKDRRAKVNELTREKRDAIKARLDEKKAALKPAKELKALNPSKELKALKGKKRKREAEPEEAEPEEVDMAEMVEMKKTYLYAMEQAMGVWSEEPRLTRYNQEELAELPDASRAPVEYLGMVLDYLHQGDWSPEAIRNSFEWSGPVEQVVEAIWSYGEFVRPAHDAYLATIKQELPHVEDHESLHWIYLCHYHNKRSVEELNTVFEGFMPDKPRLLKAMAEYISYF